LTAVKGEKERRKIAFVMFTSSFVVQQWESDVQLHSWMSLKVLEVGWNLNEMWFWFEFFRLNVKFLWVFPVEIVGSFLEFFQVQKTLFTVDSVYSGHCLQWTLFIVDIVYSGLCLQWILFTVDPVYSGPCLQWTLFIVDPVYSGPCLQWTLFTVDPVYSGLCL
jgi:hypothetical protein